MRGSEGNVSRLVPGVEVHVDEREGMARGQKWAGWWCQLT